MIVRDRLAPMTVDYVLSISQIANIIVLIVTLAIKCNNGPVLF